MRRQGNRSQSRKRKSNKPKVFTYGMQKNFIMVFAVVLLLFSGLIVRMIYLKQENGERYAKKVLSQQSYVSSILPYQRGSIMDRNKNVLARSDKFYNVIMDPKVLLSNEYSIEVTLKAVSEIFEMEYDDLYTRMFEKEDSSYVVLKKYQEYEKVAEYERRAEEQKQLSRVRRMAGIWFEEEYVRTYPYGNLASHILGYTNAGNVGTWGIEQYYNSTLNGVNGRVYGYYDAQLNLERTVKAAMNGYSIVSTIDANVQGIVEKYAREFVENIGCENIGIILMNPNSGEIYSMVSNEGFDLNNPRDLSPHYTEEEIGAMDDEAQLIALNKIWRNFCISDTYEPGSTFKPFTVAAGLEEDLIRPADTFECIGFRSVGGWHITCNNKTGHGRITLAQSLMLSCNPALMDIGAAMERDLFYRYQLHFGFGKRTSIDLPGEEAGILTPKGGLNVTELATSSFGQTFNVTMLQIIAGYASLVNGGYYYQPHVVKEIVNESGATVEEKTPVLVKETVSSSTSDFIKEAMFLTVAEGTAKGARVEGYLVGGKTGTAQKQPRADKKYVVSFIGNVPANDPQLIIFVAIDEIHDEEKKSSSSVATELTSRILKDVLPFLGIYPEGEIDYHVELPQISLPDSSVGDIGKNDENGQTEEGEVHVYNPANNETNSDFLPPEDYENIEEQTN